MNCNFDVVGYWKFLKETKGGNAILLGVGFLVLFAVMGMLFPEKKNSESLSSISLPKAATKATTHLFFE